MLVAKRGTVKKTRLRRRDLLQIRFKTGEAPELHCFRPNAEKCLLAEDEFETMLLPYPAPDQTIASYCLTIFAVLARTNGLTASGPYPMKSDDGVRFRVELS